MTYRVLPRVQPWRSVHFWEVVDETETIVRTYTSEDSGTLSGGHWNASQGTHEITRVELIHSSSLTEDGRDVRFSRGSVTTEPCPEHS